MRKILMILAIASMSSVVMAQGFKNVSSEKYQVLTNKFFDNWFVSAGIGAEMLISNSDVHVGVGDRISPTFNASLGKWFTPGLGLRLQYSGYEAKGSQKGFGHYAEGQPDVYGYYNQKFNYMNLHGDVLFNLSAMIGGYNPDRVYEFVPYLGAGFTHSYSRALRSDAFAANAGIINKFKVSPSFDVNVELSGMMVQNKFDRELGGYYDFDGVVSATVGLTYYFKKRGFDKVVAAKDLISESELRNLRNKMNDLSTENQGLKDQLARKPKEISKEVIKPVGDVVPHAIFFEIGSSVISSKEEVNIGHLADYMKKYPDLKVELVGYADKATGSSSFNQQLTVKRAEAVAKMLVEKFGIDKSRLSTDGKGGVDKYQKIYLNRMVLVGTGK